MKSPIIELSELQRRTLEQISNQRTGSVRDKERACIIIGLSKGMSSLGLAKKMGLDWRKVHRCRLRWASMSEVLAATESKAVSEKKLHLLHKEVKRALSDTPRSGCPSKFSAEQFCQILAVTLETPSDSGHQLTHWSLSALKQEVEKRGIVAYISRSHLGAFLKGERCETAQSYTMVKSKV